MANDLAAVFDHERQRELPGRAQGCVLLGDPAFYGRFGFVVRPGLVLPGVPPEYFQAVSFHGAWPVGEVRYHAAFGVGA